MIQLNILSGKKAGTEWVARRFPFLLGRSPQSSLVMDDPGVWDRHAEFSLDSSKGVVVSCSSQALLVVNGQPVQQAVLRNGDLIEAGSVKIRFSLAPGTQYGLSLREALTWVALIALCFGQIVLIYWLAD